MNCAGFLWGDVDRTGHTLTIERSVATMGRRADHHKGHEDPRRQATGPRHLRGRDPKASPTRFMEDRAADLGISITPDSPIFTYDLVRPIAPDTVSHYVRSIATKVRVDTHLHVLRHFAATELIGGGHDVRTVAGRLGHPDASVTLKVYSHALPERDRDAVDGPRESADSGMKRHPPCRHERGDADLVDDHAEVLHLPPPSLGTGTDDAASQRASLPGLTLGRL